MKPFYKLFSSFFSFFINGMLAVITANIMQLLINDYNFSYNMISLCIAAQSFGNLLMVAVSGFIIKKININNAIYIFMGCFIIGCCSIFTFHHFLFILISMFITGIGWGLCNNSMHIVINSYNPSLLNILHMSYAAGSFSGPFLLSVFMKYNMGWKPCIFIIIVLCILLLIFYFFCSRNDNSTIINITDTPLYNKLNFPELFKDRFFIICLVLYFIYIGFETIINSWLIPCLTSVNLINTIAAQNLLSIFWICVIMSRFLNSFITKTISADKLLFIGSTGSLLTIISLLYAENITILYILIILSGLFIGIISPCNAIHAGRYLNGNGIASGILFAGGGIGSIIFPLIAGTLAQYTTLRNVVLFMIILLIIFAFTALLSCTYNKIYRKEE